MTHSPASLAFVHALQQQGAGVYMVGGTVRDELLGHPHNDLDLLVTGLPQQALLRTLRPHGRVQLTGRAFGVIKFLPHGWDGPPIDIALPRMEVSTGVGHRDFAVTFDHALPVETDLGRRDFTINAMAIDLAHGQLLDPFAGSRDLQQRQLRQVSPQAFPEDPLRMLRGIQLAARLALTIEPLTYEAMQLHAAMITTVAAERIAEELRKLFQAQAPSQGFRAMQDVGLLSHLFPELAQPAMPEDAFAQMLRRLDTVQQCALLRQPAPLDLLLTALFWNTVVPGATADPQALAADTASMVQQRLTGLKMTTIGAHPDLISTLLTHRAFNLSTLASPAALRHFAYEVGVTEVFLLCDVHLADRVSAVPAQAVQDLLDLRRRLQAEIDNKAPLGLQALALDGHDLQHLGMTPGPQMGQLLQQLLRQVLDDPQRNTRAHLLALTQTLLGQTTETPCGSGQKH